jgi:hypothetical protein
VSLERCPFSLVSTTEELLGRKSSGSGLENREYCRRNRPLWPRGTLYPEKFTLTSPTSGGRSVGIVHSLTQATEFSLENTRFQKLDLFLPSIEGRYIPTLLGPLQRANLNHWTTDEVKKPSDSDCYTPVVFNLRAWLSAVAYRALLPWGKNASNRTRHRLLEEVLPE